MEGTTATTGDKTLTASGMPQFQFGYFLASNGGAGSITPPGSAGVFCLAGGPLGRYNNGIEVFYTGTGDSASLVVDPTSLRGPNGGLVATAGQTWNFQAWHRENGGSSNFTNAVSLRFD
ncbi:MAG: hypothetical protein JKY61_06965 [Planctomycetes bacterium]|nr:hypothetical protein [Planctomycetota bacterium]